MKGIKLSEFNQFMKKSGAEDFLDALEPDEFKSQRDYELTKYAIIEGLKCKMMELDSDMIALLKWSEKFEFK